MLSWISALAGRLEALAAKKHDGRPVQPNTADPRRCETDADSCNWRPVSAQNPHIAIGPPLPRCRDAACAIGETPPLAARPPSPAATHNSRRQR